MAAEIIDGKAIAQAVRDEVRDKVTAMRAKTGKAPGLAVVLVGERKDSQTYVRSKKKACEEAGIESFGTDLPEDATEEEVLAVVAAYNADPNVHGILVQLPMPKHINEERVRLDTNCKHFLDVLNGPTSNGKKLGFIAQEIGREINTMGSKANDADIQRGVVQMKDELEKIKEQVLNAL